MNKIIETSLTIMQNSSTEPQSTALQHTFFNISNTSKLTPASSSHMQQDINNPSACAMWQPCTASCPSSDNSAVLASPFTADGESMLDILHTSSARTRHVRLDSSGCCVYISVTLWPCGSRGLITLHLCVGVTCYIISSGADVNRTGQFYR